MTLPIKEILNMMVSFDKKYGIPFPVSTEIIYKWAMGTDLPKNTDTVIYTGGLYQLVPYIKEFTNYLESIEEAKGTSIIMKFGERFISLTDFFAKIVVNVSKDELEKQYSIIRNIVELIKSTGTDFGYLYDKDMYTGVLLFDYGLKDAFKEHAESVHKNLKESGVKAVITIDPHTTYILKTIYPKILKDFNINVINYLELLYKFKMKPKREIHESFTIHDPCYYARNLNIITQPRELLLNGGVKINEPFRTKELTFCCGSPVETLSPSLSKEIAKTRLEELVLTSDRIITMCPMCNLSLSRVNEKNASIEDISEVLKKIYL
jgi:Fe-S oxidoreductase